MTRNNKSDETKAGGTRELRGCSAAFPVTDGDDYGAVGPRGHGIESPDAGVQLAHRQARPSSFVVYINCDSIGGRDSPHGKSLLAQFLYTLTEIAPQPQAIILVNSAVRLTRPGSEALESLSLLHEQGVLILVEENSVRELVKKENIAVGKASTMHTILDTLLNAEKILYP